MAPPPFVFQSGKFLMGRCPKDAPTAKKLVWNKSSSHFLENLEKPFGVASLLGHRRVKILHHYERGNFANISHEEEDDKQ